MLLLGLVLVAVVVGLDLWLHRPSASAQPDAAAVHADIAAGRSGAEVTVVGSVIRSPMQVGDHQRIDVRDQLGDTLELDYNTALGRPLPVRAGDSIVVHGQLYVDAGRAGVHCLHAHTSRGCPQPGWVQLGRTVYS